MTGRAKYLVGIWCCVLLSLVFILAGIGKLFANLPTETDFLQNLSPVFTFSPFITEWIPYILPWFEVMVGLLLLLQLYTPIIVLFLCVPLVTCFLINNYWMIVSGMNYAECNNCFGVFEKFISLNPTQAFVFDIILFVLCCIIVFSNQNYPILYGVLNGKERNT
jgi:uncharacterized membrane protein YphA (DoxX/SURF4 family)